MTNLHQTLPDSCPGFDRSGAFRLDARRALALQPATAGELRIVSGRVWATLDGGSPPSREADHVLRAGDRLQVPAGARLVVEDWPVTVGCATHFDWDPLPIRAALPATRWHFDDAQALVAARPSVAQAIADWGRAWHDLAQASLGLARAVSLRWGAAAAADNAPHGAPPIRPA